MIDDLGRWMQHPLVPLFSLGLAVVGIVLAIVCYLKGRRTRSLRYEFSNRTLVEGLGSALEGLEVHFNGARQDRVTVARVATWNNGTETINAPDVAADKPLGIVVHRDGIVLDAKVVDQSDQSNCLEVHPDRNTTDEDGDTVLPLSFEYLDPSEVGVIQVVHTGTQRQQCMVVGKVKGGTTVSRVASPAHRMFSDRFMRALAGSRLVGSFGVVFYGAVAMCGLLVPTVGVGSWWWFLLFPFGTFAAWAMYYGYVMEQVPARYSQQL